ncbi:hypothetical protein B0H10DRAFT_2037613 [Mycena sp. CBHHK59/15]|nr:hypothetical protein B0H10DRAFT_2037613 [Mycena sp. CBHHK59/15]
MALSVRVESTERLQRWKVPPFRSPNRNYFPDGLPAEIVREIVSHLPTRSQVPLCETSRRLNEITVPTLYRCINLETIQNTIQFCRTLMRADGGSTYVDRHDCVRSLVVAPHVGDKDPDKNLLVNLLEANIQALGRLECLNIWVPDYASTSYDGGLVKILPTLTLPHLRRFCIHQPHASHYPTLAAFLNRHEELTHLDIIRPWGYEDEPDVPGIPVHLPSLKSYRGSSSYALNIVVRRCGLETASLWDVPHTTNLYSLLAVLAAATSPKIPFSFSILWDGPWTAIFRPVAQHLPTVHTLEIGPFMGSEQPLSQAAVETIAKFLGQLKHLAHFRLDSFKQPEGPSLADSVAIRLDSDDLMALTTWGQHCPSLVTSSLHCKSWRREECGEWNFVLGSDVPNAQS